MCEIEKDESRLNMENQNPIFVMMVFSKCERDDRGFLDIGASRIVGFRYTLESATYSVKSNMCDIWETVYDYAVIEEVEPCLYPCSIKRWFFKYNMDKNEYELIKEPDVFKNSCGLTIG